MGGQHPNNHHLCSQADVWKPTATSMFVVVVKHCLPSTVDCDSHHSSLYIQLQSCENIIVELKSPTTKLLLFMKKHHHIACAA